jgi:hypothetical protein
MRIRTIKPQFWEDEQMASWPPMTRLAYIALWNEADDEGRLRANTAYLASRLFPYERGLDLDAVLRPIVDCGKLVVYRASGQTFGFLPRFLDHQVINRPSRSKLPEPPEQKNGDSLNTHGALTDDSSGKGKEGKGKERSTVLTDRCRNDSAPAPAENDLETAISETEKANRTEQRTQVLALWRELCPTLTQPRASTPQRIRQIDGFISKMGGDMEAIREVFEAVAASDFLCGRTRGRDWKADLFWVIQPRNLANLIDGKYDNSHRASA